jgi:hypothetical protein
MADLAKELRPEWVISVEGTISERPLKLINPKLETGKVELHAENLEIYSKAKTLPFEISEKKEAVNEEIRMFALHTLGQLEDPKSLPALIKAALYDSSDSFYEKIAKNHNTLRLPRSLKSVEYVPFTQIRGKPSLLNISLAFFPYRKGKAEGGISWAMPLFLPDAIFA